MIYRTNALVPAGVLAAIGFAMLAVLAPLATYTVSLAAFGLPHVLSELRYIDKRFGRRIELRFLWPIALLLPLIVAIRASLVLHLLPARLGMPAELGGVALLALSCARGVPLRRVLALLVAAALGVATFIAPFTTAVALSILHNFTPLGFFWQILPPARRPRAMAYAAAVFLLLPLAVATGWPRRFLEHLIGPYAYADPLDAGGLARQLFVYVPSQFIATPHAVDLFSAAVVAQGAHYASVILILPLLLNRLDKTARGWIPWPPIALFGALCAVAATISLSRFFYNFAEARALYGIFAAFHAWLEIPVLVLALTEGGKDEVHNQWRKRDAHSSAALSGNRS